MKRVIEFPLEEGGVLLVEAEEDARGGAVRSAVPTNITEKAQHTFAEALGRIKPAAEGVITSLRGLSYAPDEVSVEFGIRFSAEAGAVIASVSTQANIKVTINWKHAGEERR